MFSHCSRHIPADTHTHTQQDAQDTEGERAADEPRLRRQAGRQRLWVGTQQAHAHTHAITTLQKDETNTAVEGREGGLIPC
jgi:ABC-type nickel/cobalt efflux system permease component RcnA